MIAYIDSSVILRMVLGQPDRLREWNTLRLGVGSALVEVECLKTLDRLKILHRDAGREVPPPPRPGSGRGGWSDQNFAIDTFIRRAADTSRSS